MIEPYVFYIVGVLARILLPYAYERLQAEGPLSFDWRYLAGQVVGAGIGLIPVVLLPSFAESISGAGFGIAFGYGWGTSDIGNRIVGKPLVARNVSSD